MTVLLILIALVVGVAVGVFLAGFLRANDIREDDGWWTVVVIWPASKERYLLHVQADGPRAAEDLVEWEALHNHGGQPIWVAAVFPGKLDNADKYATFEDPDVKPTDWNPL